jgi:protein-disulfide isomerase
MASQSKNQGAGAKTPKQLAAEARAASEAAERRRERLIRIVGGIAVLVVVAGVIAIGFFAGQGDDGAPASAPTPDASAPSPTGVTSETYGVPYGAGWDSPDAAKLPTLEIWEDFQCPACAQVEAVAGDGLKALADEGLVKLMFRPAIFLDNGLAAKNAEALNPNSSARATSAWGCAVDAGRTGEYHSAVFANQPAEEGTGFSEQLLIDLGSEVGITGDDLTTFTTCVQEGRYLAWAANSNQKFYDAGVGGTPTGYLNGVELNSGQLADVEGMKQLIADATAQ